MPTPLAVFASAACRFPFGHRRSPVRHGRSYPRPSRTQAAAERLEERLVLSGFSLADFNDAPILLVGDAAVADGVLRLGPVAPHPGGISAAWHEDKQSVGAGFDTTFRFRIDQGDGGSGFTFAIQNYSPGYVGEGAGDLGYNGLLNSLVIEFDTALNIAGNESWGDPSPSHISIHTRGTESNSTDERYSLGTYDTTQAGFILDNGEVHTARIAYSGGTLQVYLNDLTSPVVTVAIDLNATLALDAGRAWVGFTGGSFRNHDVLDWDYTTPDSVIAVDRASTVEGSSGTRQLVFTVTRTGDVSGAAHANWSTVDGTATAGDDYAAASGIVSFAVNETTQTVSVAVVGETLVEQHETLLLRLSDATNAAVVGDGVGTILNDETAVSVTDGAATEGSAAPKFIDRFVKAGSGGLNRPRTLALGHDGNLYVISANDDSVLKYDGATGSFLGVFVQPGSGGLDGPQAVTFGPDGNLYVAGAISQAVHQYDGVTGDPIGDGIYVKVGPWPGGQPRGIVFDAHGHLYMSSGIPGSPADEVLRFTGPLSGSPGEPLPAVGRSGATFVTNGSGGLTNPGGLAFGPDGNLYVAEGAQHRVLRYDGVSGDFLGVFVAPGSGGLNFPNAISWRSGYMYVTSQNNGQVLRYDALTGAFSGIVAPPIGGGVQLAIGLALDSDGNVYFSSRPGDTTTGSVLRYGAASQAVFTVRLSAPSTETVTVNWSTADGTAKAATDYVAASGTLTFLPGETEHTVIVKTVNDAAAEGTEAFSLLLTAAANATIADGTGIATVTDEDPATKFYVVNDGTADRTYEYGTAGQAVENYGLNSGNTAPRGAASTTIGDKVWVVDANKKVFVYNAAGALLGSWTANGLSTPEGIATDGVDVWVVDRGSDKVFRYAGAATRTSGSATAVSSFNLNNQNKEAKGIEVAGGSLYVVNDTSSSDKVFKYNLAGSFQGSWTIDAANKTPTGITLDPTNPSDVWIVDAGTDRVYRYANAASRTSGSQNAADSFVLSAGNTNPQGIADPPDGAAATTAVTAGSFAVSQDSPQLPAAVAAKAARTVPGTIAGTADENADSIFSRPASNLAAATLMGRDAPTVTLTVTKAKGVAADTAAVGPSGHIERTDDLFSGLGGGVGGLLDTLLAG